MGDVVTLRGNSVGKPNAQYIAMLEDELQRARAGDTVGGALIRLHSDMAASWAVAGVVGGYSMLGALQMVQYELVEANHDD